MWQDKGKRGERLAVIPPYGYRKAEDNNKQLVIDDEIAVMPGDKCILRVRGERPFFSKKFDPFSHKNFKHTADADKEISLDVAGLLNTKLALKANDKFDTLLF